LFLNGKSLGKKSKKKEIIPNPNLVTGKAIQGSSENSENPVALAIDGDRWTAWRSQEDGNQWWQVDLGSVQQIGYSSVNFVPAKDIPWRERRNHPIITPAYTIKTSADGQTWANLVISPPDTQSLGSDGSGFWQLMQGSRHEFEASARFIRIEFTSSPDGSNGITEFDLYKRPPDESYYDVVDLYRLRWNDVIYEPGQLKAVAYKNGKEIGQATMQTAAEPAKIRLTPDRDVIKADGYDLSYILVEMVDDKGNLCPLADNRINFSIAGPVEIAAVGNGDQTSLEPFQAEYRKLFYGKAMLIIRSKGKQTGMAKITASSDGVSAATVSVQCK